MEEVGSEKPSLEPQALDEGGPERRLRERHTVLVELLRGKSFQSGVLPLALREITEAAARILAVERTSVWLYSHDSARIACLDLFLRGPARHEWGTELWAGDYPSYFRALEEDRVIAAHDAHHDPRTCEFSAGYLAPLGITSMLDAPIRRYGKAVGVVCHEHVGPARTWSIEEQILAGTMADMVSLAMDAHDRRRAEESFRRMESRRGAVFHAAIDPVVTMDAEGRIMEFNAAAEQLFGHCREEVAGRTVADVLVPPALRELHLRGLARYLATRERRFLGRHVETMALRKDGSEVAVELSVIPLPGEEPPVFVGYFRDMTERRRIEEQLRRSERESREAAEELRQENAQLRAENERLRARLGIAANMDPEGAVPPVPGRAMVPPRG